MQGGDLRNALALSQDQEFNWYGKGRQICLDVLKALVFLHKSKVRSYLSRDPRVPKGSLLSLCHSLQVVHHDLKVGADSITCCCSHLSM